MERSQLDRALPIFALVARRPTFAPAELERQRLQALDDLKVSMADPSTLAGFAAARAVYGAAPYGAPVNGAPQSLAALTPKDEIAFHQAWWRPDLTTLVLSGDLTPEEGFAAAQRWFGDWARPSPPPPSAPPPAGPPLPPRVIVVDLPQAGQAAVIVARRGLERRDPRHYAALVANQVLGGGFSSRLNNEIRIKRGLSYGASSGFAFRRAPGPFVAMTQTKKPSAPEVAALILSAMKGMTTAPATPEELKARQSAVIGEFGRTVETTSGTAEVVGRLSLYGIDLSGDRPVRRPRPGRDAAGRPEPERPGARPVGRQRGGGRRRQELPARAQGPVPERGGHPGRGGGPGEPDAQETIGPLIPAETSPRC